MRKNKKKFVFPSAINCQGCRKLINVERDGNTLDAPCYRCTEKEIGGSLGLKRAECPYFERKEDNSYLEETDIKDNVIL